MSVVARASCSVAIVMSIALAAEGHKQRSVIDSHGATDPIARTVVRRSKVVERRDALATVDAAGDSVVGEDTKPFLFVGVISGPANQNQRDEIRESWFNHAEILKGNIVARFVIGETDKEIESEDDILRVPGIEGAGHLVQKTVELFKWFADAQPAEYLLKIDDDSFPDLGLLLQRLHAESESSNLYVYGGIMVKNCPVFRGALEPDPRAFRDGTLQYDVSYLPNTSVTSVWDSVHDDPDPRMDCDYVCGKWDESPDFYPKALYPRYAAGSSYVVSSSLVQLVAAYVQVGSQRCQSCNEDASVGIWMTQIDTNNEQIKYLELESTWHGCNKEGSVFSQNMDSGMQRCMWQRFQEGASDICTGCIPRHFNVYTDHPQGESDCAKQVWAGAGWKPK